MADLFAVPASTATIAMKTWKDVAAEVARWSYNDLLQHGERRHRADITTALPSIPTFQAALARARSTPSSEEVAAVVAEAAVVLDLIAARLDAIASSPLLAKALREDPAPPSDPREPCPLCARTAIPQSVELVASPGRGRRSVLSNTRGSAAGMTMTNGRDFETGSFALGATRGSVMTNFGWADAVNDDDVTSRPGTSVGFGDVGRRRGEAHGKNGAVFGVRATPPVPLNASDPEPTVIVRGRVGAPRFQDERSNSDSDSSDDGPDAAAWSGGSGGNPEDLAAASPLPSVAHYHGGSRGLGRRGADRSTGAASVTRDGASGASTKEAAGGISSSSGNRRIFRKSSAPATTRGEVDTAGGIRGGAPPRGSSPIAAEIAVPTTVLIESLMTAFNDVPSRASRPRSVAPDVRGQEDASSGARDVLASRPSPPRSRPAHTASAPASVIVIDPELRQFVERRMPLMARCNNPAVFIAVARAIGARERERLAFERRHPGMAEAMMNDQDKSATKDPGNDEGGMPHSLVVVAPSDGTGDSGTAAGIITATRSRAGLHILDNLLQTTDDILTQKLQRDSAMAQRRMRRAATGANKRSAGVSSTADVVIAFPTLGEFLLQSYLPNQRGLQGAAAEDELLSMIAACAAGGAMDQRVALFLELLLDALTPNQLHQLLRLRCFLASESFGPRYGVLVAGSGGGVSGGAIHSAALAARDVATSHPQLLALSSVRNALREARARGVAPFFAGEEGEATAAEDDAACTRLVDQLRHHCPEARHADEGEFKAAVAAALIGPEVAARWDAETQTLARTVVPRWAVLKAACSVLAMAHRDDA
jgi:hypothetical protein